METVGILLTFSHQEIQFALNRVQMFVHDSHQHFQQQLGWQPSMPLGIRPNRQSLVSPGRATIKPSIPGGSRARALKHRPTTMLNGSELLAKAKELGDASKSNLVRSAYTAQLGRRPP